MSFPNLCTNPAMQVWQNDKVLPAMEHRTVLADGYLWGNWRGSSRFTGSRCSDVPVGLNAAYSIDVKCVTTETRLAADTDRHIRWAVFGEDFAAYQNRDLNVRFWAKTNRPGIYSLAIVNETRTRTFVIEYAINSSDEWERKDLVIPFSTKTGAWNLGQGYGFGIRFTVAGGAGLVAPSGIWHEQNYVGSPNQVNLSDAPSNYFRMTGLQIHAGGVPEFFLPRYEDALYSAHRQYRVIDTDIGDVNFYGFAVTADTCNWDIPLSPPMMVPPSVSFRGVLDTDIVIQRISGGEHIAGVTLNSFPRSKNIAKWVADKVGGYVAGQVYSARLATANGKIVIDGHLG